MIRVVLDFETAYGTSPSGRQVTLSKMTTEEYVRDCEFKIHGLGVKIGEGPAQYLHGASLLKFLKSHPWERTFAIAHHCLPGEVEVLTKEGWSAIAEASETEEIMQWNPKTAALSWARPLEKIAGYADELLAWNTSFHRCAYTTEHRMFYRTPNRCGWRVAPAQAVSVMAPNNVYLPLGGVYAPEYPRKMTPELARLMEAVRADGSFQHRNGACYGVRFKLQKQRKIERLRDLFYLAGVMGPQSYEHPSGDGYTLVGCKTHPKITELFTLLTEKKVYGSWVLDLSVSCREAILDEARHWDGHQRNSDKAYQFSTVDPETAEAFELMAHCTGQSVSGSWIDNNRGLGSGNNRPLWCASVRKRDRAKLVERPERRAHNAPVYCFTVPTGAFLIRSNGRVLVTGNSHFDGAILSWKLGIRPAFWGCTLSMARALFPAESSSLDNISKLLGLGEKGKELVNFKDKWTLTAEEQRVLGGYCINDTELTARIFARLVKYLPVSELRLIDWTVRCFTEPLVQVDREPLVEAYKTERRRKRELVKQCVAEKDTLASSDKFATLLLSLGVDPPKKLSLAKLKDGRVKKETAGNPPQGLLPSFKAPKGATAEEIKALREAKDVYPWSYGFGKSDEAFKLLLEHPDPQVQAVVEARLGVKSTIRETRSKRFFKIGKRGAFPVYLLYYGAHTGRWSGGDKQNAQNLNRIDPKDPTAGALRMSWIAPPGHVMLVRDLSQIEARMLAYFAGQDDLIELFHNGGDPYNRQASMIFGYEVDRKKEEFYLEGLAGKASVLGNGYGLGWSKFQEALRIGFMGMPSLIFGPAEAEKLGAHIETFRISRSYRPGCATLYDEALLLKPEHIDLEAHLWHCASVKRIVDRYRESNPMVVKSWKECGAALPLLAAGEWVKLGQNNTIETCKDGLVLPNGMKIRYTKLRANDKGEYRYLANARKKEWVYLYGGKMVENIIQALSRIVLSDQLLDTRNYLHGLGLRGGEYLKIVSSTHDELVLVCPERLAAQVMVRLKQIMATPPAWCTGLPLKSSGGYARSYGDCEK